MGVQQASFTITRSTTKRVVWYFDVGDPSDIAVYRSTTTASPEAADFRTGNPLALLATVRGRFRALRTEPLGLPNLSQTRRISPRQTAGGTDVYESLS